MLTESKPVTGPSVSAFLRRAGFQPSGSANRRTRQGLRVTQSGTRVTVTADLDSDREAARLGDDLAAALTEGGYTVTRTRPHRMIVTRT